MSEDQDKTTFDKRMRMLMDEQERLEQEQHKLRGDAENELKTIDPKIAEMKAQIAAIEGEMKGLERKRRDIETFLAKLTTKGGRHPLRRGQQAA